MQDKMALEETKTSWIGLRSIFVEKEIEGEPIIKSSGIEAGDTVMAGSISIGMANHWPESPVIKV